MIFRMLSNQVPEYWDVIKFATVTVDEVREKDVQKYLLELLHSLLSNNSQCWIRVDDNKKIIALLITRIIKNKITKDKSLYLQCVFSYEDVSSNIWKSDFSLLINFAKQEDCENITFESRHSRIWELAKSFKCKEIHRSFIYDLR